jgi:hypothetical protein
MTRIALVFALALSASSLGISFSSQASAPKFQEPINCTTAATGCGSLSS